MLDYKKLYFKMFNAATDAVNALEALNVWSAKDILRRAQQEAEDIILEDDEEETEKK